MTKNINSDNRWPGYSETGNDNPEKKLATCDQELLQLKKKREQELKEFNEAKTQAEEAKATLEIRAAARTKALRDLTESLEKQVEERTAELKQKIEESENSRVALMNMLEDMEDLRRHAEEEKEKTLAMITNFSDGLMFFGADDRLELANSQVEKYFNVSKEELLRVIGKRIVDFSSVPNFLPLVDLMGGALKRISRKELSLNEKMTLEVSSLEVGSRNGKIGTLVIAHDITREKTIERMKTEFVSVAAHQLRTPISAIKWTLRMVLDGDLGPITDEQKDFLEKTYKSNERMINLINDLLNITRIEEGRHLYNLTLVSLEEVVAELATNYLEIAGRKNLKIEYQKPKESLPQVKVDIEKIKLVVSNLIENAIKYTPTGGTVSVSVARSRNMVQVSVHDTGMGIMEDQKDRIFTKYFRGSNAVRMETEGTGLGLFIAKNIVETHGGKIWFVSEENQGTTFAFVIPEALKQPDQQ